MHLRFSFLLMLCFAALGVSVTSQAETPEEAATIGRQLEGIAKASTFIKLLKNTDRAESLLFATNSSTTVFVPTNAAFERLSDERRKVLFDPSNKHWLERVLTYHAIHGGRVDNYTIENVKFLRNGLGQYLKVEQQREGFAKIEDAKIEQVDIACSNGIIHFIDTVLDPIDLDLFERLEKDGRFNILTKLIKRSGLTKLFQNRHKSFTVFAPTDAAFESLPDGTVQSLLSPEKLDLLSDIIRSHIANGVRTIGKTINSQPLGTPGFDVINEYQQELIFRRDNGEPTIDGRSIIEADIVARNGILHIIDAPLLPKRESVLAALDSAGKYETFLELCRLGGIYDFLGQYGTQLTVFAPQDSAFETPEAKAWMDSVRRSKNMDSLRGVLQRHIVEGRRILLTNAISFQRFNTDLGARVDIIRDGNQRKIQGINIIDTDMLARNGIAHGIDGIIPFGMELPDQDQNWRNYRKYIRSTLIEGSRLFSDGKLKQSTEYFARRNYEFIARYGSDLGLLYGINPTKVLTNDRNRNFDYDFANTAWKQRNGFRNLLRQLESKRSLIIDEMEFEPMTLKPVAQND